MIFAQSFPKKTEFDKTWSNPKKLPDHILLNYSDDPATTVSVSWRTSREINSCLLYTSDAADDP